MTKIYYKDRFLGVSWCSGSDGGAYEPKMCQRGKPPLFGAQKCFSPKQVMN